MRAVVLGLMIAGCTHSSAPKAKTAGKVMSLGGVAGLIAVAFAAHYTGESTREIVVGFSTLSGLGIATYAVADLGAPASGAREETTIERHQRWARILTERAYGYARDGRCHRVRHIETRVRVYDRELHDFVFMKDPEIVKCLTVPAEPPLAPPGPVRELSPESSIDAP